MDPLEQIKLMIEKRAAPLEARADMLEAELHRLEHMMAELEKRIDELEAEMELDAESDTVQIDQPLSESSLLEHLLTDHGMQPKGKPTHISLTIDLSKSKNDK